MMTGGILPFVGRVITPCDEHGQPSGDDTIQTDRFETRCLVAAWLGFCGMWAYGDVVPRLIDPTNPKAYAPGNMAATFI